MQPDLNAVEIPLPRGGMFASLAVPDRARALIIFAHGSGSSRHSPRNRAVVSRGGRPDLAGASLPAVEAPTLLLVGSLDADVITLNQWAQIRMKRCAASLKLIAGASHLFEEPGTLEQVASKAADWFSAHLAPELGASDRPAGTAQVS